MRSDPGTSLRSKVLDFFNGAFGAGLVLIVLPSMALVFWIDRLAQRPSLGLPILAIFGIMILFGALAIISALFSGMGLASKTEALALPPGSIRAAIALALIVLFALIAVMLYQSLSSTYEITGLTEDAKIALVKEPGNTVMAVVPACPEPGKACTPDQVRYTVHLRQSAASEATDLAKQLLILIGTLMTSVTSFYFASRATEVAVDAAADSAARTNAGQASSAGSVGGTTARTGPEASPGGGSPAMEPS